LSASASPAVAPCGIPFELLELLEAGVELEEAGAELLEPPEELEEPPPPPQPASARASTTRISPAARRAVDEVMLIWKDLHCCMWRIFPLLTSS
jgi:hypothetical protein